MPGDSGALREGPCGRRRDLQGAGGGGGKLIGPKFKQMKKLCYIVYLFFLPLPPRL